MQASSTSKSAAPTSDPSSTPSSPPTSPSPSPSSPPSIPPTTCPPHTYTTQIISLDPLLIYITNFLSPSESTHLIHLGTPLLTPSPQIGHAATPQSRTSWSAPLPASDPTTACVLSRASSFLGTLLSPGRDTIGPSQMVRYTPGQKFDIHTDWFAKPRIDDEDIATGRRRLYNRVATLFVVLQANHTAGGETWFPRVRPVTPQDRVPVEKGEAVWREHEEGGLAFKAVPGNALFWVNLMANGSGDARTVHAGLPVEGGTKHAMNIWPRVYFGPDA
ncbi:hypothetical protein B0T16DRAFT_432057 [Cercophora newfieldiana]|uniref:Prolyl 4-hydroxylase alpha subunit domain-containing protein n=1 Tax=Cercophora newfieldiana TaxID=92897 RepID=A0AA39XRZ1_9PEZI|nr:hypothetical protein B0T16DRAFT_432057 [Cercophora newfieldiana]